MNKNFLLLCSAVLILAGCKKSSDSQETTIPQKVAEVLALPTIEAQKVGFSLLTDVEKVILWQTHIKQVKKELHLDAIQHDFVDRVINELTPAMFNVNTKIRYAGKFAEWMYEGQGILSKEIFGGLFGQLSKFSTSPTVSMNSTGGTISTLEEGGGSCDCSKESDMCPLRGGAHNWEPRCKDVTPSCAPSNSGCGFLWNYKCDGYCVLTRVNEPPEDL